MMTVAELRELLSTYNDEAEVRLATQPAWPLAFHVQWVATTGATCEWFAGCERPAAGNVRHPVLGHTPCCLECAERLDLDLELEGEGDPSVVWLVAGDHPSDSPYAPQTLFVAVAQ